MLTAVCTGATLDLKFDISGYHMLVLQFMYNNQTRGTTTVFYDRFLTYRKHFVTDYSYNSLQNTVNYILVEFISNTQVNTTTSMDACWLIITGVKLLG